MGKEKFAFTDAQLNLIEDTKIQLQKCICMWDTEMAHIDADDALIDLLKGLGLNDVAELYVEVSKWYA